MGRDTFHCPRLLQAPSSLALDTARDPGAATASLGTLCQGLPTLPGMDFPLLSNLTLLSGTPHCTDTLARCGLSGGIWLRGKAAASLHSSHSPVQILLPKAV
uniref:Uncharacterized protein n=1 Tax=Malurus cyaneus samueli TaxID=2593467 RepID=A0A8C5UCU2_9PASS